MTPFPAFTKCRHPIPGGLPGIILILILFGSCAPEPDMPDVRLVDEQATRETRLFFANLKQMAPQTILFGHQDALAYGVEWWREEGRSDVRDVSGSHPAVFGWELGDLELGAERNLDDVRFDDMQRWIAEGYRQGGVITISWHMNNPVSGGNAWDTTPAVASILPGGENNELYTEWLDRFAEFVHGIDTYPSPPLIFRPFHEHTGSWFWWGRDLCTVDEFVSLWRYTVDYLRDEKGLHNLLYAYSPDIVETADEYLERYPGDAYVDVIGIDDYHTLGAEDGIERLGRRLQMVVELAESRNKIPAFTETGSMGIPDPEWWTERLLAAIRSNPVSQRIAWVLVWRNANEEHIPGHHFAPYAGHASAENFVQFREDPLIYLLDDLPDLCGQFHPEFVPVALVPGHAVAIVTFPAPMQSSMR